MSLELTGGICTLYEALDRFCAKEVLDEDNAWECGGCLKKVCAVKSLTIRKAPEILMLHLKRFETWTGGKISSHVEFPSTLDLQHYLSTRNANDEQHNHQFCRYALYGVLVHSGLSSHGGHYFAFVNSAVFNNSEKSRNKTHNQWFEMDDDEVRYMFEKERFLLRVINPNICDIILLDVFPRKKCFANKHIFCFTDV